MLSETTVLAQIVPPDRRIIWEGNVGIPGGIPKNLPIWAQDCTVSIPGTTLTLNGNGTADNATTFAYIIANCPIGQVAKLGSGVFYTSQPVDLVTRGIVLRGNGPANTTIKGNSIRMGSGPAVGVTSSLSSTAPNPAKGDTTITLTSPSGFTVGKQISIEGGDDASIVNRVGYETTADSPAQWYEGTITAVNGSTITVSPPLFWKIDKASAATPIVKTYQGSGSGVWTTGAGVEDLKLQPAPNDDSAIVMATVFRSWLKNIEVDKPRNHCIYGHRVLQSEITHCYLHDATINGSGGGYGVTLENGSSGNLIYDNIANNMTGAFQVNEGSSGNVFAYNYIPASDYYDPRYTQPDFQNHSAHPMMNLWEGNYGFMALFDDIHGSSSHHTLLRNRFIGYQSSTITSQQFAIGVEAFNTYVNIVGNVLGDSHMTTYLMKPPNYNFGTKAIYAIGYDFNSTRNSTAAFDTLLIDGNWDSVTGGITWKDGVSKSIPNSFYLPSKPTWFGDRPWPPFDPSNPTAANPENIPAGYRWVRGVDPPSGSGAPSAPTSLQVQ